MSSKEEILDQPDHFDRRELCPDGACVGVIGRDGVCTVCGGKGEDNGSSWRHQEQEERAERVDEPEGLRRKDSGEMRPKEEEKSSGELVERERFDPERKLCPDGGCIGVIGPDGRSKECGKSW